MMKKLSVLQKLTFSYCLLVLGIMVLTGIFILPIELKGLDRNLESNISNTASMLSYDPEIINGLNKKVSSTLQLPCPSFLRGGFLFLSFSFIIES